MPVDPAARRGAHSYRRYRCLATGSGGDARRLCRHISGGAMSPSHILEPTYRAIKQRLMCGEWPAGFRLDTARIATDLGVSTSPVRDSLNRLAGECMVD